MLTRRVEVVLGWFFGGGSKARFIVGLVVVVCGGAVLWLLAVAADAVLESLFGGVRRRVYLTLQNERPWRSSAFSSVHPPWVIPHFPPGR